MNKKILLFVLLAVFLAPVFVSAAVPSTLTNITRGVRDTLVAVGGVMVVIGFVVSGILWLTSAGSPERMGTAKKALIAAVIGAVLIVVASASDSLIKIIEDLVTPS
jgi:UDP-N-acetylmuramyl pentapeptide phosphotransferase/UDP-N-acetylglucosamine-1-phosphate transferase